MNKCCYKGCEIPPPRKWGGRWYCKMHYRFKQMRDAARRDRKVIPTVEHLVEMTLRLSESGMKCPLCEIQMNWLRAEGQSTCLTLQHDASGSVSLICLRCNTQHGQLPGDLYYDIPKGQKWCACCEQILPVSEFYPSRTIRQGIMSRCKSCEKRKNLEWKKRNRAKATAWERERMRRKREAAQCAS